MTARNNLVRQEWKTTGGASPLREVVRRAGPPLALIAGIALWGIAGPEINAPLAPPSAMLALALLTIITGFVVRALRIRYELDARAALALPDPLYTLYLAAVILTGGRGALLLAVLTPLVVAAPGAFGAPGRIFPALRESAAAGLTTLIAGLAYTGTVLPLDSHLSEIRSHLLGAVVASLVMFLGAGAFRITERAGRIAALPEAWREYIASPAMRFQLLMLVIGPLLPLAELLDDLEAELAWILFLVPLFAMYYLALLSVRLEQRTNQLQATVAELRASRLREAELTGYAALITSAQEDERRRLARELHDDTAQALVALSRGLDALATQRGDDLSTKDARFLTELGDLAKRSLDSIRRACQDLRPSVLDDLGLAPALESLANLTAQRGLPCTYTLEGTPKPCAPEVEVTVYRIAQEALTNVRRHAEATQATLAVTYGPHSLELNVADDGKGFAYESVLRGAEKPLRPGDPEPRSGLGLLGMRERAALIGARLDIQSSPGAGTLVTLVVPLDAPAPAVSAAESRAHVR